jgi:biopolymer transport protein TolQ
VTTDLSIIHLFLGASPIVQLVMLALLAVSILSWFVIFHRGKVLRWARRDADAFEQRFWSGTELGALFKEVSRDDYAPSGMERIFEAGFREFARLRRKEGGTAQATVEGAQRAMRVALMREQDHLEHHLSFLATVGSTSPYVGLFGTVWGIMNAFRALGNVQQATIAMVAPGIAEALVATAMGLFAAIPAVIAYNRFANDAERLGNRYENFLEEFAAVLQRQAGA